MTTASFQDLARNKGLNEDAVKAIEQLLGEYPPSKSYLETILSSVPQVGTQLEAKKRKLEQHTQSPAEQNGSAICVVEALSFQFPRKKADLAVFTDSIEVLAEEKEGATNFGIRTLPDGSKKAILAHLDIQKIRRVLFLQTPEKSTEFYSVVFEYDGEMYQLNIPDKSPQFKISWFDPLYQAKCAPNTGSNRALLFKLLQAVRIDVMESSARIFKSRKDPNLLYAPCKMKAKDFYMYFFDQFIFIGFKRPMFIVNLKDIASCDFLCVLTRTFDISIECIKGGTDKPQAYSFEMIETKEFEVMLDYFKSRKAKGLKVGGQSVLKEELSLDLNNDQASGSKKEQKEVLILDDIANMSDESDDDDYEGGHESSNSDTSYDSSDGSDVNEIEVEESEDEE
jgi:hypothetical protein